MFYTSLITNVHINITVERGGINTLNFVLKCIRNKFIKY